MDWQSIAALIAERSDQPLVLLDRTGRIRLVTAAMEHALGWRLFEVEGRTWAETLAPPDLAEQARRWIANALRGAIGRQESQVMSRSGERYALVLDLALVGQGRRQGLLVTVQEMSRAQGCADLAGRDLDYRVATSATDFGTLEEVACIGKVTDTRSPASPKCFAAIHGRPSACADCPILDPRTDAWPRTRVRRHGGDSFQVLTAEPVSETSVQVSVRTIAQTSLVAIHEARIHALSEKAHLTERERDVLKCLLLGRTLDEIAILLELSPRTVKFHQGNILQKLGADSRADLIRFVGF
jgi:PAS domain S-box-containing protein